MLTTGELTGLMTSSGLAIAYIYDKLAQRKLTKAKAGLDTITTEKAKIDIAEAIIVRQEKEIKHLIESKEMSQKANIDLIEINKDLIKSNELLRQEVHALKNEVQKLKNRIILAGVIKSEPLDEVE